MHTTEVPVSEIAAVAAKLDESPDLSPRERAVLALVFSLAGEAAAEHTDEVTGFMPTAVERVQLGGAPLGTPALPTLNLSIVGSFTKAFGDGSVRPAGAAAHGGGGGAG